ncbi:MAG: glycosyltransferase family 2 protein [Prevotella sp.]|nr:glycosyltransferase family 2 protein [Prevotella sp.]
MIALKIAFWICIALVVYTYVGYAILLWLLLKVKRLFTKPRPLPVMPLNEDLWPTVTLMICAYNERDVIAEKMENIRQLRYPRSRLCVIWVTDGSTDDSNELLRQYPEVTLVFSPERRGKAAAMQHGISVSTASIVVFTDANTLLNEGALVEIVRQMQRPGVSCVSGEKRVKARAQLAEGDSQAAAEGEGLYWRYESTLKRWDSELYSAMGAAGELFAVKMEHYRQPPSNALLDDFMMSMLIVSDGHRIAYTSEAYASEYGSASMADESKRKRRIAAGGLQSIWWLRSLMNPFRHPRVFFQFISHRVLRWSITPFALAALLPLNIALVLMHAGTVYVIIAVMQLLFYAAAFLGWQLALQGRKNKWLYVPYYFLFMNFNVFLGIPYLFSHGKGGMWEKVRRA